MLDSVLYIVHFNNQNNEPTHKLIDYIKTDRNNPYKQLGTLHNFPPSF